MLKKILGSVVFASLVSMPMLALGVDSKVMPGAACQVLDPYLNTGNGAYSFPAPGNPLFPSPIVVAGWERYWKENTPDLVYCPIMHDKVAVASGIYVVLNVYDASELSSVTCTLLQTDFLGNGTSITNSTSVPGVTSGTGTSTTLSFQGNTTPLGGTVGLVCSAPKNSRIGSYRWDEDGGDST